MLVAAATGATGMTAGGHLPRWAEALVAARLREG